MTDEMSPNEITPNEMLLDAVGLRCPLPVIRLAKAARTAPPGTVITLLTTDPAAEPDVAAWCRMRNHHLLAQTWLDAGEGHPQTLHHTIQTLGDRSK
jgi:tRNA 2-thiouridine synthesizing protein A